VAGPSFNDWSNIGVNEHPTDGEAMEDAPAGLANLRLRGLARGRGRLRRCAPLSQAARKRTCFHTGLSHRRATGQLPPDAERLEIREAGGSQLAAVIMRPEPAHDSGYWILHLHGNADSAFSDEQLRHCQNLKQLGFSVLGFDYRGFGLSAGVASEAHMDQDAEAALAELIKRGVSPTHIIIWGHSLCSGPAVLLASEHSVAALVLFGAFTSIPDAAQDTYPYLPVKWIASIRFSSIDLIPRVHVPVLIAHSATDTVIPLRHAERLYAAANEPKRLLVLRGAYSDGLGGHIAALYEHGELLMPALWALIGVGK
jgi:alpha-beta hydrolase superfamily lysophospholipase